MAKLKKLKRYQYERYAVLCKLAYPRLFDHEALGFSVNGYRTVADLHGNTVARILWKPNKKEVIVVFRGTQSLRDWLVNFCVLPRRLRTGENPVLVHFGYYHLLCQKAQSENGQDTQTVSVYQAIIEVLSPLIAAGKRVTFTGHSSGGAIAVLAAHRLEQEYQGAVKRVVTFGQPSTGFRNFHRHYSLHRRTYRICCDLDMVTFLPPLPGLYRHVGRSLWLHNGRIYENTPPVLRLYKTLVSWVISPISYHYMQKYIRNKDFFDEH